MMTGIAQATLTTIGTATYDDGSGAKDYKLIWDDDNNGRSLVWLDYRKSGSGWDSQVSWASSLNTALTVNLYDGYAVDWENSSWRLPIAVDGIYEWGYDGTTTAGFNITSSELGHLFYEELGNVGYYDIFGNPDQPGWWQVNTGDFENFILNWYWFGTETAQFPGSAWGFYMGSGEKLAGGKESLDYAIAVRSGQVTYSSVPTPGAIILLGAGLLWIVGSDRRSV